MAKFKVRRPALFNTIQVDAVSGTEFVRMIAGSVSACVGAVNASASVSGSIPITGLTGSVVLSFVGAGVLNASAVPGLHITSVCATGANGASVIFYNSTGENMGASVMGWRYFGVMF